MMTPVRKTHRSSQNEKKNKALLVAGIVWLVTALAIVGANVHLAYAGETIGEPPSAKARAELAAQKAALHFASRQTHDHADRARVINVAETRSQRSLQR